MFSDSLKRLIHTITPSLKWSHLYVNLQSEQAYVTHTKPYDQTYTFTMALSQGAWPQGAPQSNMGRQYMTKLIGAAATGYWPLQNL